MLQCGFCGQEYSEEEAEIDHLDQGFFCDCCDGYTYIKQDVKQHRFTLLLEENAGENPATYSKRISFNRRLSILRFPGGKAKIIPFLYSKLIENSTTRLVSPFTGGGSFELAMLEAGVIRELLLNDLDFGIYALFWSIINAPDELCYPVQWIRPTHKDYFEAQTFVKSDYQECNIIEAAWATLLGNRLAYSGIYSANPLGGRKGTRESLLSRWNPVDLCKRIKRIHQMGERITVSNIDACELIEEEYWSPDTTIFLDPPYVQKGKQLYRCYYTEADHLDLNMLLESLYRGVPGADIILIYDNDPLIERIYSYPTIEKISRVYSI
ncbi:DNA adenine methylase [Brevibacillus sp. AG]|nr:DNA adenine methylase [Brevibacillus sp. AG]MDC0764899.1 DNA adenine methylase [Brevibacillus sp. AG]